MTFTNALRALRAAWPTMVLVALVGALAGLAVSLSTPPSYAARTSVFLAGVDASQQPGADVYSSSVLLTQRVATYKELMTSPAVTGPAAERVGVTPGVAAVTASGATGSTLIQISVTAADPGVAARTADAVAVRFGEVVEQLDRPNGPQGPPAVRSSAVAPAQPPSAPVRPETALNTALGAALGLLAAAFYVVARRGLDTSVRSGAELRRRTGRPVLGCLPDVRDARARRGGPHADAVREVRTRLRLVEAGSGPSVLSLSGATSDVATTTLVGALATAFAGRSRVLMIDADLRHPRPAKDLGLDAGPGLGDVLAGTADVGAAVRRGDGLDVLGAGSLPDDPTELLTSAFPALLAALRTRYDVILVDTTPLSAGVDSAVVARHVDGVVLVCRAGVTTTARIDEAVDAIEGVEARLLGSVLTHASRPASRAADEFEGRASGSTPPTDPVRARGGEPRSTRRDATSAPSS